MFRFSCADENVFERIKSFVCVCTAYKSEERNWNPDLLDAQSFILSVSKRITFLSTEKIILEYTAKASRIRAA